MTLPADKVKCFKLHTKMDIDMVMELRKAAKSEEITVSELVRQFLDKGLREIKLRQFIANGSKELNGSQTTNT